MDSVTVNDQQLDVVVSFCYLGDSISAGGGSEAATVSRVSVAWGKFWELLPILGSKSLSLHTGYVVVCSRVYNSFIRRVHVCFMLLKAGP